MSHNAYPAGWISPVPTNHVPGEVEYELLWDQVYAAINGDDGGTWAPSAFITVGGSGFQLTGTAHSLAASARLNVENTGEIRVKDGGLVKADGTSGDIRLEVLSNVATLTAQTGTLVSVNYGATVEVNGAVLWKTAGPGVATWETGTTATFDSGATLELAVGSTTNARGALRNYGTLTVKSTGNITFEASAQMTSVGGSTWSCGGALSITGDMTLVGSNNWVNLSPDRTVTRGGFDLIPLTYLVDGGTGLRAPRIFWFPSLATNGPAAYTEQAVTSGDSSILRLLDLPVGAVISSVVLTTQGSAGSGASTTFPTYQIVSWANTSATGLTTHSSAVADAHVSGNWLSAAVDTTVTPSSTTTITAGRSYGIKVVHPYDNVSLLGTAVVISAVVTTLTTDVMKF